MSLFDQTVSCEALPHMNDVVNSKLTRTVAGNVIKEFKLLLATDALKTSDTLSDLNMNRVTVKTGKLSLLNDTTLEDNYIVNMAQVVDPATNIRKDKAYRFAFVPMRKIVRDRMLTSFSEFYELQDTNEQFTCKFTIVLELMNDHAHNTVIAELKEFIRSNANTDFLSRTKTTPTEFFKHARLYVFPVINTRVLSFAQQLSVTGLCIQTDAFNKAHGRESWLDSTDLFKIHRDLSGFSVDEVLQFMKVDVPKTNDIRAKKWLIRHYLDWKRMGDSFQITHLSKLIQLNNANANLNTLRNFHPYYFVSIDILAIIQAIMFNVNFIYQINGNAFVIGNNQMNKPMSKYIVLKRMSCQKKQQNKLRQRNNQLKTEQGANVLMNFVTGQQSNNNNNNYQVSFNETMYDPYYDYSTLPKEDLLRLLKECKQRHFIKK